MKHDIFIDNNIASKFANPADPEYKELIRWLMDNHEITEGQDDDRAYIPAVLLSDRKYALTYDENFTYDLENFPGFTVIVKSRPEELPYK